MGFKVEGKISHIELHEGLTFGRGVYK